MNKADVTALNGVGGDLNSEIDEIQTLKKTIPTVNQRIRRMSWASTEFKIGLFVFCIVVLGAIIVPLVSPHDPIKINYKARFLPPVFMEGGVWSYPMGTDQLGRDLFVRSMIGLRYSLAIGIITTALMLVIGTTIGIISGFKGGYMDKILMRICDVNMSIPIIILAITILGLSRPTIIKVILTLAIAGWPLYARVVRAMALAEREKEYVRSVRIVGASDARIMLTLLAPIILPPNAFVAVMDVARMMIFEAILGFIGLGIQPPTPTFGTIIADGRKYMMVQWWIASLPGGFLFLTLCSLNLVGATLERVRNKVMGGVH